MKYVGNLESGGRLERLGYPAFVSEAARLADIPRLLRAIGALAGTLPAASAAAAEFEREIGALKSRYANARKLRSSTSSGTSRSSP